MDLSLFAKEVFLFFFRSKGRLEALEDPRRKEGLREKTVDLELGNRNSKECSLH